LDGSILTGRRVLPPLLVILLVVVGASRCAAVQAARPAPEAPTSARAAAHSGSAPTQPGSAPSGAGAGPQSGVLAGICEASTVVPWKGGFLVGDNESPDALFTYTATLAPLGPLALATPIDDIEALAPVGDDVWVVGSQSTTKHDKVRPLRERIGLLGHAPIAPDFTGCPACVGARGIPPQLGGFNIEGAMVLDDHLWLGLRSPVVEGKALLVDMGGTAAQGDGPRSAERVVPIDLGGRGVRELVATNDGFYVIAGPVRDEDVPHELWWFSSVDRPGTRLDVRLPPSTEGIAPMPDGTAVLVTDGDGKPGSVCAKPATWRRIALPPLPEVPPPGPPGAREAAPRQ
jgi:hypothetical protein